MDKVICSSFFFGNGASKYMNMDKKDINSHNEVYIKTVVCLFSSARYFSKDTKLIFFINDIQKLNDIKKGYYIDTLKNIGVDIIEVSSKFVDETRPWAGSMFIFDIVEYLINQNEKVEHSEKKGYFFLDTDVVFLNDFDKVLNIVEKYEWAGYAQFSDFGRFNCWIENFHGIDVEKDNKVALPYGGEFLYLDSNTITDFFDTFKVVYEEKRDTYFTEEHYYTSIFNTENFMGKRGINVNPFLKRAVRANRCLDDQYLWAVHFPGEKDYKLKYLFNNLQKNNFVFSPKEAKKTLGVNTVFNYYDLISTEKIVKGVFRVAKKKLNRKKVVQPNVGMK